MIVTMSILADSQQIANVFAGPDARRASGRPGDLRLRRELPALPRPGPRHHRQLELVGQPPLPHPPNAPCTIAQAVLLGGFVAGSAVLFFPLSPFGRPCAFDLSPAHEGCSVSVLRTCPYTGEYILQVTANCDVGLYADPYQPGCVRCGRLPGVHTRTCRPHTTNDRNVDGTRSVQTRTRWRSQSQTSTTQPARRHRTQDMRIVRQAIGRWFCVHGRKACTRDMLAQLTADQVLRQANACRRIVCAPGH